MRLTSSSLPPQGSASSQGKGERARRRAVRRSSRCRMRLVRWRSAVSEGVRKKVSSASEGRFDHPPLHGESGGACGGIVLTLTVGRASRRRRASYLCGVFLYVSTRLPCVEGEREAEESTKGLYRQ